MSEPTPLENEIAALDAIVDDMVQAMRRQNQENQGLRQSQQQLNGERANLMARNEQARSRVEAMIQRLKALENNH